MEWLRLFMEGGPMMFPLALILIVEVAITVRITRQLFARGGADPSVVQGGLDGLLFWGGFAAVIGTLGSFVGYQKIMAATVARGVSSLVAMWVGTAEGMVPCITGLLEFAIAGTLWYTLRWRQSRDSQPTR